MISYSRLRRELNHPMDRDDELAWIRSEVVQLWERATGRLWIRNATRVDDFLQTDEAGARTLLLRLWPVQSIATVQVKTSESDVDWTTLVSTDWRIEGRRELRRIQRYWECLVRVTYSGGYLDDEAPPDILRALVVQARFMRDRFGAKLTVRSENFEGGGGVFETADMHPYFDATAQRYRRLC